MLKQYLYIFAFYFCSPLLSAQINSFSLLSAANIKALGEKISDAKKNGFVYSVLDSLTRFPQSVNRCEGTSKQLYSAHINSNQLLFKKTISGYETNLSIDTLTNNAKNNFATVNAFPFTVCDNSNGSYKGRIYISWADAKHGLNNNDVYLTYSNDGGESWMDRILVTFYPNHKQQFMPRMALDEHTGVLYFLYCNQQNYPSGNLTDVFLTVSKDGGKTFSHYKLNSKPISWQTNMPYSKYFSLSIDNGIIYPTWLEVDDKKTLNILSATITDSILKNYTVETPIQIKKEIPYVYSEKTKVSFNSSTTGTYTACLYKATEPKFEVVVSKGEGLKEGENIVSLDFKKLKLPKATYVLMLYTKNTTSYVWILEE